MRGPLTGQERAGQNRLRAKPRAARERRGTASTARNHDRANFWCPIVAWGTVNLLDANI
jgi:hypothetical protein